MALAGEVTAAGRVQTETVQLGEVDVYVAAAPELYARTGAPGHDFAVVLPATFGLPDNQIVSDVESVADYLLMLDSTTDKVAGKDVQLKIYEGAGHAFLADYRESCNEEKAHELWADVHAYLQAHL